MYKIKQAPEDFIVKEIIDIETKDEGSYSYYLLRKRNYTTVRALQRITDIMNARMKDVGSAGSKDKAAVTEQMISVKNGKKNDIEVKDISLKFVGRGNEPINLGDLEANEFEIIVRDADKAPKKITRFVNFFGEQRFSRNNKEIGKSIVKGNMRKAVELILENEGDYEEKVREYLNRKENDYIGALKLVPKRILRMFVHAYQSHLWNEMAKDAEEKEEKRDGELEETEDSEELPLIGFGTEKTHLVEVILEKEGVTTRDFVIKQMPDLSSEGAERKLFAEVRNLEIEKIDEKTFRLKFRLPKGSYATEFIKALFQI